METDPEIPQGTGSLPSDIPPTLRRIFERKELFLKFGYDLDRERDEIVRCSLPLTGKILEAGPGKGHFSAALARQSVPFISVDISSEDQKTSELFLNFLGLRHFADLRVQNGEQLNFPDATFDMVFSINALHHFEKPYKVADELIRVLKPRGRLVISDFSEKGFDLMDQIHALEGNSHSRGELPLTGIEDYLEKKDFILKKCATVFQQTLVAEKP
jgi:ubiquinone/menaquinone biosynthesis C-methylase UbiE